MRRTRHIGIFFLHRMFSIEKNCSSTRLHFLITSPYSLSENERSQTQVGAKFTLGVTLALSLPAQMKVILMKSCRQNK